MIGDEGNLYDYAFDYGDIRFIGLNTGQWEPSTNPASTVLSGLSDGQMDWLDLQTIGADHIFVFGHGDIVGHDGEYNPVNNREAFVEWANSNPVEAYFCGHTHLNNIFIEVADSNIDNPDDLDNPCLLHTIEFSEMPFYIESEEST